MTDDQATTPAVDETPPRPLPVRVALWTAGVLAIALALWGMVHVTIPPVNPARKAPAGHWPGSCWVCHVVSDKAPLADGD